MSDAAETPPDRLSVDPTSPYHDAALLERGIGIRFNGAEKNNVEEYCVSEGWVRLSVGKTVDRHGKAMTVKYKGTVEPYFRDEAQLRVFCPLAASRVLTYVRTLRATLLAIGQNPSQLRSGSKLNRR